MFYLFDIDAAIKMRTHVLYKFIIHHYVMFGFGVRKCPPRLARVWVGRPCLSFTQDRNDSRSRAEPVDHLGDCVCLYVVLAAHHASLLISIFVEVSEEDGVALLHGCSRVDIHDGSPVVNLY